MMRMRNGQGARRSSGDWTLSFLAQMVGEQRANATACTRAQATRGVGTATGGSGGGRSRQCDGCDTAAARLP